MYDLIKMYDDVQHFYYVNTKILNDIAVTVLAHDWYSVQIDRISCAEGGRFEW